jgi:hypothetical protein
LWNKPKIKCTIGAVPQLFSHSHSGCISVISFIFQLFICVSVLCPIYLFPPCRLYTNVYLFRSLLFNFFRSISSSVYSSVFYFLYLSLSSTIYCTYCGNFYFLMVCLGRAMSTYRYRLDASHDIQPVD